MLVNGRVGGGVLHGAAVVVRDVGAGPAHDPLLGQSLAVKKAYKHLLLYVSHTILGGGRSGDKLWLYDCSDSKLNIPNRRSYINIFK